MLDIEEYARTTDKAHLIRIEITNSRLLLYDAISKTGKVCPKMK